ncbi:MAG: phosphoserine phosphatase SerB [Pseudomonadota bacterium]
MSAQHTTVVTAAPGCDLRALLSTTDGQEATFLARHACVLPGALGTAARERLSGYADITVLAEPPTAKRLLIADMESTIIEQEMLDELADAVGARDKVEAITAAAMRGELDFEQAITERVALLEGLEADVLDQVADARLTYMPGARALVTAMKAADAHCALVSGGFTCFTARVAHDLGFDTHRANTLDIANGKLTGRVVPPILGRDAKQEALDALTASLGIDRRDAIAVGDGANDLAMLTAAGIGVAFRAKPLVRDAIAPLSTGAVIDHCDLTAVLYVQGMRGEQSDDA